MPVNPTYPGIYIEELPSAAHTITAAPTSITVFIGYTHPFKTKSFGTPVRIFSFTDYERMFGGLFASDILDNSVPFAVQQFFLNGGADAYVVGLNQTFDTNSGTEAYPAAKLTIAPNLELEALEPTDVVPMTVTLSNANADTADITIGYGRQVETYRKVSLNSGPDYINERLKESKLVKVVSLGVYGAYNNLQSPAELTMTPPTGEGFHSADFTDVLESYTDLDKVDIFNLMVIPGCADATVLSAAQAFCEKKRAFLIMDAPDDKTVNDVVQHQDTTIGYLTKSPNSALYMPYLQATDPLTGDAISLPPSGYIAGIFARTDTNRGVWKAPAGLETIIKNTTGVIADGRMTDMQAGVLNDATVNAIRTFPGVGTVSFGARTHIGNPTAFEQWRYIPVRRTALFIEQTLYRNLGWVVFEPNDEPLWSAIRNSIERFMLSLFKQGAFQGSKPSEAFLVKCDSSTTTQDDIDKGRVNILVGFRPLKPAEFVVIQITQLAGQAQA